MILFKRFLFFFLIFNDILRRIRATFLRILGKVRINEKMKYKC